MTPPVSRRPHPLAALVGALLVLVFEAALLAFGLGGWRALAAEPRAWALLAVWGATGWALAWLRPVSGRQDVAHADRDLLVMLALLALPYAMPVTGAWAASHAIAMLPNARATGWTGVALSALGLAVRVASMLQLGARFSPLVAVQREHALETGGLYALVRHPGYLGSLVAAFGASIAFGSAAALPLWVLMLFAQWARVRREERLLERHFGDDWRLYARRTGMLLPGVGVAPGPRAARP